MSSKNDWSPQRIEKVRRLIPSLYKLVAELNEEFAPEKRKFTPDGHMVGSIGEVIAAYAFDLDLLPASTKNHDARTAHGELAQIKLTAAKSIGFRGQPNHVLVLRFHKSKFELVFNGPGNLVLRNCGKKQTNGQRSIGLSKLTRLNGTATPKLPQIREFPL